MCTKGVRRYGDVFLSLSARMGEVWTLGVFVEVETVKVCHDKSGCTNFLPML